MHNLPAAVSRRSVLVSGLAVSLLGVSAEALPLAQVRESVLSGRLTDAQHAPLRHADVSVAGVTTRTDGDGRFFLRAPLPAQGHISLHIVRACETSAVMVSGLPDRLRGEGRETSSLALVMAG